MNFTTETPLTNSQRFAIWHNRYIRYKAERDKRINYLFRVLQPSFLRDFSRVLAEFVGMAITVTAIFMIAQWVSS